MALLPWAPSSHHLSPATDTRPTYRVTFIQWKKKDKSPPGAGQLLHSSLWLVAFRFQTLSPSAALPFPPSAACAPSSFPGPQEEEEVAVQGGQHPGLCPSHPPVLSPCSHLGVAAGGGDAGGLVARLVILLAVVHPRHHRQDEGLRD